MSLKSRLSRAEAVVLPRDNWREPRHAEDPALFASEVLGLELDDWQAGVLRSTGKRDLLNCARQSGKTTTAGILALHHAVYRPASLTLLVSPSERQSKELFKKIIDFRATLPHKLELAEDNKLSMEIVGGGRVVALPGSEGTIRGFSGASLIIEDEAARVPDELYFAVRPMLITSGGRLILMSTPFGKRGHFWQEWSEGLHYWRRVMVPATECPRISPEALAEEKARMPTWWYEQEYLCQFKEATDAVFSHEHVMGALSDEVKPLFFEVSEVNHVN